MPGKELKEKQEFIGFQMETVRSRLKKYLEENKHRLGSAEESLDSLLLPDLELDWYIQYRSAEFSAYCDENIDSHTSNFFFSTPLTGLDVFDTFFNIKTVFCWILNKKQLTEDALLLSANINTGVISILEYPSSDSNFQIHFAPVKFSPCKFELLEKLFYRPFNIRISLNWMQNELVRQKLDLMLGLIRELNEKSLEYLKYMCSYEYCEKYGYNELFSEAESEIVQQNDGVQQLEELLSSIQNKKQIYILNLILVIAPCFISLINLNKYKDQAEYYIISWADMKSSTN